VYLFDRFFDTHHHIRNALFEKIDEYSLRNTHLFKFVRIALLELSQLPVVLFARLASKHIKLNHKHKNFI
jgi:hypothetical protein